MRVHLLGCKPNQTFERWNLKLLASCPSEANVYSDLLSSHEIDLLPVRRTEPIILQL